MSRKQSFLDLYGKDTTQGIYVLGAEDGRLYVANSFWSRLSPGDINFTVFAAGDDAQKTPFAGGIDKKKMPAAIRRCRKGSTRPKTPAEDRTHPAKFRKRRPGRKDEWFLISQKGSFRSTTHHLKEMGL